MMKDATTISKEELLEYVFQEVPSLREDFATEQGELYKSRIWEAYEVESLAEGTQLSPQNFVSNVTKNLGWDWVKAPQNPY